MTIWVLSNKLPSYIVCVRRWRYLNYVSRCFLPQHPFHVGMVQYLLQNTSIFCCRSYVTARIRNKSDCDLNHSFLSVNPADVACLKSYFITTRDQETRFLLVLLLLCTQLPYCVLFLFLFQCFLHFLLFSFQCFLHFLLFLFQCLLHFLLFQSLFHFPLF